MADTQSKYGNYPEGPGNAEVLRRIQASDSQGLVDPVPGAVEMAAKYAMGAGPSWLRAIGALPGGESQDDVLQGVVPGPIKAARRAATAEQLGIPKSRFQDAPRVRPQTWLKDYPGGPEVGMATMREEGNDPFRAFGGLTKSGQYYPDYYQRLGYKQGLEQKVQANSPLSGPQRTAHNVISDRDMSYHATDLSGYEGILNSGEIKPLGGYVSSPTDVEIMLKEMGTPEYHNPDRGTSFSRSPRVASKEDKPITLALDNSKMPPTRPFAEQDYQKTIPEKPALVWQDKLMPAEKVELANIMKDPSLPVSDYSQRVQALYEKTKGRPETVPSRMNPNFESENRTYNKAVPTSAIKKIMVDLNALSRGGHEDSLSEIQEMAKRMGYPVEIHERGRSLHSSPAGLTRRIPRPLP